VRWFTDQLLAPRPDWYRPDLATRRVRQLTRTRQTKAASWGVPMGLPPQVRPAQPVQEVLTYDAQGYLLRYRYLVPPAKGGGAAQVLTNQFSYDAQHRLSRIQVEGSRALLTVADVFSSKAYDRLRRPGVPAFRRQHGLPAEEPWRLFPETWQLHHIRCRYDAAGRALPPQAVVTLSSSWFRNVQKSVSWTDTVALDPRRDWHLATPDTLAGFADTAWLSDPARWWQLRVPTTPTPGLRVQAIPDGGYNLPTVAAYPGITSFFGPAGQLQLARLPGDGTVWRYRYDTQGQPQRVEAYFMHLPDRYGDTLYFGSVSVIRPIPDCENRQRQARPLSDGRRAVRELQWVQEVRYEPNGLGLPQRAVVLTTTPRYAADVSFNDMLSPVRVAGHDGPWVRVKGWRHIKAQLRQRQKLEQRGCVPMTLVTEETHVILFGYEFFP
jgi:YD repeat-containing protein